MKSVCAILVILAAFAVAFAQVETAAAPAQDGGSSVVSLISVNNIKCYLSALWQVATFVADIPRNCLDLAWRSNGHFFYVLPMCVVESVQATSVLYGSLLQRCIQS
ncbi:Receptor-type guanylate cyclase gcy-29 [Frankliniella fusca]|uniref:Receptor-type guanylate cyclase gcy-29 n=1 Tax=Frankliniella fusca TaxID=407009 RepID=A0AAE1HFK0_9NEOP|nr:Receptor-type guanylate cyclase gcy-29 [Frankliniella fusca]